MFGTAHPQPPPRKEVAMQVVQHEQKSFDKTLTVEEIPGGHVAPPPAAEAIRFDVIYTLGEYLGVAGDHAASVWRRRHAGRGRRTALLPLAVGLPVLAAAWIAGPAWLGMALAMAALLALASHPVTLRFWMLVLGTPIFLFKKWRMPSCSFRIDGAGIERTSRAGTFVRAWSDVAAVRRYRRGYLLLLDKGAVPIPYRCLDQTQQEAFRKLARAPAI
nr:YcxB family protein [uncultured Massilia sp.]